MGWMNGMNLRIWGMMISMNLLTLHLRPVVGVALVAEKEDPSAGPRKLTGNLGRDLCTILHF